MPVVPINPATDAAVARSQSVREVVNELHAADPSLTRSSLLAAKSPWGLALASVIGMASAHYGLGLDDATSGALAGLVVLIAGYVVHAMTHQHDGLVLPPSSPDVVLPPATTDSAPALRVAL